MCAAKDGVKHETDLRFILSLNKTFENAESSTKEEQKNVSTILRLYLEISLCMSTNGREEDICFCIQN